MEAIEGYAENLKFILNKVAENGAEVIFLTQNAMNTEMSCHLVGDALKDTAELTMSRQNDGVVKAFKDRAKLVATECGAKICDIYPTWEKLIAGGVDTTELLANKINHPIREIHYYMAMQLIETMFEI